MVETISAQRLREELAHTPSVPVVDTRGESSFEEWHIPGAINYPFSSTDEVDVDAFESAVSASDRVITICAEGISSDALARQLEEVKPIDGVATVGDGMNGWSRVYDEVEVELDADARVIQLQRVAKGCLSYVVACPATGRAALVDPPRHLDTLRSVIDEHDLDLAFVLDSHVHADHVSGGPLVAEQWGVPYLIGERAVDRGMRHEHEAIADGDTLELGSVTIRAMATPGHTTDIMSFVLDGAAVCTGDTLFTDAVGRTELESPEAARERARSLYRSIHERLFDLPNETVVLPGHFDPGIETIRAPPQPRTTTIRAAKTEIDLLSVDQEAFVDRIVDRSSERPPNYETIIELNLGQRDLPPLDELTELELGPNRCAAPA
ncbi:MAG: MBL fold metallo-hydrolase [Halobacteriota archaeon]